MTNQFRKASLFIYSITFLLASFIVSSSDVCALEVDYKFQRMWPKLEQPRYFNYISSVGVDSSDNVYVVDRDNNRIQKFTSDGTFITQWGSQGTGDGQFDSPEGIAIDSSGNVYVSDFFGCRIQNG